MTTSYAKEPTLNTILFNKREYCYDDKLNSLKNFENQIFDILKKNNSDKIIMPSKVGNVDVLKKKLIKLFESWPNGIHLEKLRDSFFLHFGHFLVPEDFGFSDIVNLLTHYKDILTLKKGPNNSILVVRVADTNIAKNENSISEEIRSQIENEEKAIPDEVMNVFIAIFSSYGGGIPLDNLLPEYEIRCGKKLSLEEFNMKSIFELVSYLGPRFQLCDVNKSQSVLYDSEELHDCPCKNSLYSNNIVSNNEGTKMDELSRGKELANELFIRLVDILVTEFPQGLYLEELLCAYKGFYDAYTKEFEPFSSLEDLKNLLENEKGFFNFIRQHGKIFVTAGAFYQDRLKDATMSLNIVSFSSSYQSVDLSVLKEGSYIDINVADIYNPKKFWVIKRGKDNSEALDEMMDRMLEFYGGEIGKRFLIPKENTPNIPGSPVVALYPQDMNFYRAIVISREDVQNVKIFYIDYGTNDSVSLYSLYYLHRKFFDLPAQAIKCSLHGIQPVNKKTSWPKSDTLQFLNMARDKSFVAYINKNEENKNLHVTLYDTVGEKEVNVNQYLVDNGYAALAEETLKSYVKDELIEVKVDVDNSKVCNSTVKTNIYEEFNDSDEVGKPLKQHNNSWLDFPCNSSIFKTPANNCASSPNSEVNKPVGSTYCSSIKTNTDNIQSTSQPKDKKVCPYSSNTKGFSFRLFANSVSPSFNVEDSSCSVFTSTLNDTPVKSGTKFLNDSDISLMKKSTEISNLYDSLVHSNGCSPSKNIIDSAIKDDAIPLLNGLSFNSSSVGSENHHLDISSQKDGTVKSPNMPTLKSRINTSFPIEKDLPVHSSMEEKENGEQYNNGQFVIQNNSPVIRSRNGSNQFIKSDENVIDFQCNDSERIKPISVWNPMIDDCAQEVFYSDDDASSSSLNCEPECELLTPFHLPNGHIIHIIFLNSIHYVPFPELPLILDPSSISKLETSLCQEEERNSFTLSISRRKDIYIYMLLAREGVPYVFSPKGFVPKTISLLSLDYLIHFMNLDVENSSMEFVDLIRVHLNIRYQSHKPASYLEGLNTSATNTPRPTLSAKDKSNSLESGSKKLLKLNKAISLPSNLDICSDHNEEFSSAINVVGNSNGSIVPSVDNISMSRMGTKYNVSNNAGTSTCYDITKELAKGREKQDNLFVNSLPDKTLISQDCNKNGTYNDQYQNVDMQINNKSPLNDSNLSYIQELNYSKVSEENAIKDKNGSNPESGIVIPVNSSLNFPNNLPLMGHSLDSSIASSNVVNEPFFNHSLPFQEPGRSPYVTGELHNFSNFDNNMLVAAKNGKPPPGYHMVPPPPPPPSYIPSVPIDFVPTRPHIYNNQNYLWPSLHSYHSPHYYGPNDYYRQFYRNFIFPTEFSPPTFRPV
ncbi:UNVERIFIED_CONTAM: hypothetical protein RMT77_000843 [Armadillidium vulgare]